VVWGKQILCLGSRFLHIYHHFEMNLSLKESRQKGTLAL